MTYQNNFKRYEKKYLINEKQYRDLIALIYCKLEYDRYKKYKICNIYFDTPQFDLIRESIEKPIYKEKLRLRSYGTPDPEDFVYLEIKKKFDGIVYKRRISLPYCEAVDYCVNGNLPAQRNQITNEIDWLMSKYQLYPMLYLSYDRLAMRGMEDPGLRITFDSNILWRVNQLDMTKGDFGQVKMPAEQYIMEIKSGDAMPLWLSSALNRLEIYPKSFSKYGTIYKEELFQNLLSEEGGFSCVR
ncbi:VTC domain [uncultured Eubacterium sp.]|nr:VTC domain [uncultured Eubacterium sp.]